MGGFPAGGAALGADGGSSLFVGNIKIINKIRFFMGDTLLSAHGTGGEARSEGWGQALCREGETHF